MTCTIGMIRGNKIYFAADSLGSSPVTKATYGNAKVFKAVGTVDFLIGIAGSFNTQVLNYLPIFDELTYAKGMVDRKYMITEMPMTLRALKDTYDPSSKSDFTTIMGYDGCLYKTQGDGSVLLVADDFVCLGSGEDVAKGAMEILLRMDQKEEMNPMDILFTALDVSQQYVPSVQEPFICISSDNDEIWYYEKGESICLNPSTQENASIDEDDFDDDNELDEDDLESIEEFIETLKKKKKTDKKA
jgi:ATP-dependent protease HslVU (ClpYQ) peptidase subunit